MKYYLVTNPKFTCRKSGIRFAPLHANNPGDGVKGGRVNYPATNPHKDISLDDLKALNVRAEKIGGSLWDPLNFYIGRVQENFGFYFHCRFGQREESDEDSDEGEDETIEEESFSSDEDKENAD